MEGYLLRWEPHKNSITFGVHLDSSKVLSLMKNKLKVKSWHYFESTLAVTSFTIFFGF